MFLYPGCDDYIEKNSFQSEWDLNQTYQKWSVNWFIKRYSGRSYSLGGGFQVSFNEENLLESFFPYIQFWVLLNK